MEKFYKKPFVNCTFGVFTRDKQMDFELRCGLSNLIYEKSGVSESGLGNVVNPHDSRFVICAFDEYGNACGYASIEEENDAFYIDQIYVGCSERFKGYGLGLLQVARHLAAKEGKRQLNLLVKKDNVVARRLYEHFGFSYDSRRSNDFFFMQRPVKHSELYAGQLLFDIWSKFDNGNMLNGFENSCEQEEILACVENFNSRFKKEKIKIDVLKKACVFLDEYNAHGEDKPALRAFSENRFDWLTDDQKQDFQKTLGASHDDKIFVAARYANECLLRQRSERLKGEIQNDKGGKV
jgi:hypothetical protein